MSEISRLNKALQLYDYAIQNNISITKTLENHGLDESFIRNCKRNFLARLQLGTISREDYDTLNAKSDEYTKHFASVKVIIQHKTSNDNTINIDFEDNFQKKHSKCWTERDENDKIFKYCYEIHVRDEKPLVGNLSRTEMERLFALYPSFSTNYVSRSFLNFERKDLQKVLRVFGITKDKLFPPHLIEEYDENQLANFALKAKEINGYHKYNENKGAHYEKAFRESQVELNRERENNKFLEELIERHYTKRNPADIKINKNFVLHPDDAKVGYVAFADVHFGKCFNGPKMGRGYNKNIAHDRMMQIADVTAKFILNENINKIELLSLGDIVESIMEDGMHPGHYKTMDLFEEEQILFAIESVEDMILRLLKLIEGHDIKIVIRAIGGNHDRIAEQRDANKSRTANKIIFKILSKNLHQYGIEVEVPIDNIIRTVQDGICVVGFHGDNGLHKRKTSELVNLFSAGIDNFHVIMSGHFHSLNAEFAGTTNALRIVLPSVCSVDEYIQNDLGLLNLPGFLTGKRQYNGFKFTIEPLY